MRKRPSDEQAIAKFIDSSSDSLFKGKEDGSKYVKGNRWPLIEDITLCTMADGSDLRKPLLINMKENEWKTIERHIKDLNVAKSEWIRAAIFKTIKEEQERNRKHETRRKIILGTYYLEQAEKDNNFDSLKKIMDSYLTKDIDRKLFDLPPIKSKS